MSQPALVRNAVWSALRHSEREAATALDLDVGTWEAALRAQQEYCHINANFCTATVHVGGLDTYIHEAHKPLYELELGALFAQFGSVSEIYLSIRQEVTEGRMKHSWAVIGFNTPADARSVVANASKLNKRGLHVAMLDSRRIPAEAADFLRLMSNADSPNELGTVANTNVVQTDVFQQDLVMMLLNSISDMECELAKAVAQLQQSCKTLRGLQHSSLLCTCCCRRKVVGIDDLAELLKDSKHSSSSTSESAAIHLQSLWVLKSRHTRVAAWHGAVCNMEAELANTQFPATFMANDLLELYDRALMIARPRQRVLRNKEKSVAGIAPAQRTASSQLRKWEQLDLQAQLVAEQLGFSAEVWNAVPSYYPPPTLLSSDAFSRSEQEVRVELSSAFARIKNQIDRVDTALKEVNANVVQLRKATPLTCMECTQSATQPLSTIETIFSSCIFDGETKYRVHFEGKEETNVTVSWRMVKEDTDNKTLASIDGQLARLQPVLRSLEQQLTTSRRLCERDLTPQSEYLRRLQLGINAQVVTEKCQHQTLSVDRSVKVILSADCQYLWLLPRAAEKWVTVAVQLSCCTKQLPTHSQRLSEAPVVRVTVATSMHVALLVEALIQICGASPDRTRHDQLVFKEEAIDEFDGSIAQRGLAHGDILQFVGAVRQSPQPLPVTHTILDRLLPLKVDMRAVTRLAREPSVDHATHHINHLDLECRESWCELSFTHQRDTDCDPETVVLKTASNADGLSTLLGLLSLKGADIRAVQYASLALQEETDLNHMPAPEPQLPMANASRGAPDLPGPSSKDSNNMVGVDSEYSWAVPDSSRSDAMSTPQKLAPTRTEHRVPTYEEDDLDCSDGSEGFESAEEEEPGP